MPQAHHSVTINRPVEAVFVFVADGEKCPQWRPGVVDIKRVSGDGGVRTRYEQGVSGPMGRRIAAGISTFLMGSMVQKTMESEVATLDKLKSVLEA